MPFMTRDTFFLRWVAGSNQHLQHQGVASRVSANSICEPASAFSSTHVIAAPLFNPRRLHTPPAHLPRNAATAIFPPILRGRPTPYRMHHHRHQQSKINLQDDDNGGPQRRRSRQAIRRNSRPAKPKPSRSLNPFSAKAYDSDTKTRRANWLRFIDSCPTRLNTL